MVGSLKFDAAKLEERRLLDVPALLRQAGVKPGAPVIVGGSTHAGEEAILADNFSGCARGFRICSWCWCRATSSGAGRWGVTSRRAA